MAIELARLGARPVLIARTQGGLEETDDAIRAAGGESTLLPLDLTDAEQVEAIGPSLLQRFGRLDVLVHAAATLGRLTPVGDIQPPDWDAVIGVNLAAFWHLVRTCDRLLRAAPAGRAVILTDSLARDPRAYWGAYGATKAAQEHLALTWAAETRTTRLRVNLFEPGPVATRLRAQAMPGEDPRSLPLPAHIAPAIAALCCPIEATARCHRRSRRLAPPGDRLRHAAGRLPAHPQPVDLREEVVADRSTIGQLAAAAPRYPESSRRRSVRAATVARNRWQILERIAQTIGMIDAQAVDFPLFDHLAETIVDRLEDFGPLGRQARPGVDTSKKRR